MTVSPLVAFPVSSYPTLVVGDFNIHHLLSDSVRSYSAEKLATSFPYLSRSSELGFGLLNQPGMYTLFPLGAPGRPLVLESSFASPLLVPFCQSWDTPLPFTSWDHASVRIILSHPFFSSPPPSPNWSLTDWPTLDPILKDFVLPLPSSLPTTLLLNPFFDHHLSRLTNLLTSHPPTKYTFYC